MTIEELLALIGDNADAVKFVKQMDTTAKENVDTIQGFERKLTDITSTRDKYKQGNTLVKSLLGLETINEESINEALNSLKKGKGDDNSAEIDNLKKLLETATNEKNQIETDYKGKLQNMALDNAITNAGVGLGVANESMLKIVTGLIKEGATYEDGKIIYKNEDGSTVYGSDNKPLDIASKVSSLKADANYAGLFKADVKSGGGGQGGNTNHNGDVSNLSATAKMQLGRKN